MRISVLYRPSSDTSRAVEEFIHEFERIHHKRVEVLSTETREGSAMASLYDIFQFPAIVAIEDDGRIAQVWTGDELPLMNDVAAFLTM